MPTRLSYNKDYSRTESFHLKISKKERIFLEQEAKKKNKSLASLIREGYLSKVKPQSLFEQLS